MAMTTISSQNQPHLYQADRTNGFAGLRRLIMLPLQIKVFTLILVTILAFGTGLQYWNQRTLLENEVRLAEDKHLVIASNLALSLSRYTRDVALIFKHSARMLNSSATDKDAIEDQVALFTSINIDGLKILSERHEVLATFAPPGFELDLPDEMVLENLRIGTNDALQGVQISNLVRVSDKRYFIVGLNLPGEKLAIGYLSPDYIKTVQEKISFGVLGHSAIFDETGRAVAHPVDHVEDNMMDASGISTVRKMMNRETGVDTFFSPPMKADMIAGFTFVPETGWAVMVPQPLQELADSVSSSLRQTFRFTVVVALLIAAFGWFAAQTIVRPIKHFTSSSLEIAEGKYNVELPKNEYSSVEMWRLNEALKTMVQHVRFSNAKLRMALELEENESQRKSEFMIMASHELRNPLSGVIGMLSVCKEKTSNEELGRYLDIAGRSASQLNRIVDEMVAYAEEDTDTISIKEEVFNCGEEFGKVAGIYEKQARDAGLDFKFTLRGQVDQNIVTDVYRLFQIVGNLLENAIKYTSEGSISLMVKLDADKGDGIGTLDIFVSDTGIGIDSADLKMIFDPFFQADRSFSRKYNGLGIGLSIAQSMAKRLGGEIVCRSEKGEGSEFHLRLPVGLD